MKTILARLWKEEEGQDLTEYALLLVLMALASMAALTPAGDRDQRCFHKCGIELDRWHIGRRVRLVGAQPQKTRGFWKRDAAASICWEQLDSAIKAIEEQAAADDGRG